MLMAVLTLATLGRLALLDIQLPLEVITGDAPSIPEDAALELHAAGRQPLKVDCTTKQGTVFAATS